jgi:ABC-type Fe3+/spermidine/putrescine transport system ATPase subunit
MNVLQLAPGPDGRPCLAGHPLAVDGDDPGPRLVGIRPEDVMLADQAPDAGIRIQGVVEKAVFLGNVNRVTLDLAGQDLVVELRGSGARPERGAPLEVCLPHAAIRALHEG